MQKVRLCRGLLIHGYNKELDLVFFGGLILCFIVAVLGNRELRINWRWMVVLIKSVRSVSVVATLLGNKC